MATLGVNIDHVATIREARKTIEPNLIHAAFLAEMAGCDGITIHLREDQRHIKKEDVYTLKKNIRTRLNLEMALNKEVLAIAKDVKPHSVCLVPESRREVTTEGGLNVALNKKMIKNVIRDFHLEGIEVSLFIEPEEKQIEIVKECGATLIELHTGRYANAENDKHLELERINKAVDFATSLELTVNAGHGLTYFNVAPLAKNQQIREFNIGHSIISRAVLVGMEKAVGDMLKILSRTSK